MFGREDFPKRAEEKLRQVFGKQVNSAVGVSYAAQIGYLVQLARNENGWEIGNCLLFPIGCEKGISIEEELAERAMLAWKKQGEEGLPVFSVCLPAADVLSDRIEVPDMPQKELDAMVHWELAGREELAGQEFFSDYRMEPEGGIEIMAIRSETAERWGRAWRQNDLNLNTLTMMPAHGPERGIYGGQEVMLGGRHFHAADGVDPDFFADGGWQALYAACGLCFPDMAYPNFLKGRESADLWNWHAVELTAAIVAVFAMASCLVWDLAELNREQGRLEEQRNQFAMLQPDAKKKEAAEQNKKFIERKQGILARLSEHSIPGSGILVHLGSLTKEGAWLKEVRISGQNLLAIEGEALDYDALSAYLKQFEEDRDFFPDGPLLKKAESEKGKNDGRIDFSLQLRYH